MTEELSGIRVTMRTVRQARMCSSGARAWFARHELDWAAFLKEGLPVEAFEATGCPLGKRVAEVARGRE